MAALKMMATPIKFGPVEIKNRFIVSPMVMNCCNEDGTATEKYIAYHEEKAKGGLGIDRNGGLCGGSFRKDLSVSAGPVG